MREKPIAAKVQKCERYAAEKYTNRSESIYQAKHTSPGFIRPGL